ncbi:hypothetical protein KBD34_02380 [Patescibacteria group bacterium]|nr:hypothetical protein [Patescibacteria group bacterium]
MQPLITAKWVQALLATLLLLILLCLAFLLGAKVGQHRSGHFCNWNNHRPEGREMPRGPRGKPDMMMPMRAMPLPNGVFGRVLSASGTTFVIQGRDRFEQSVLVTTSTAIRLDNRGASSTDIQTNTEVGVFGAPNEQGQIQAHLIRLFPARR